MLRWLIPLVIFIAVILTIEDKWQPIYEKITTLETESEMHVYQGQGRNGTGYPPSEKEIKYGAFATSANTFSWGSSYGYKAKDLAIKDAIARCAESGAKDCTMQMWFYHGCAALAIRKGDEETRNGSWGSARKATKEIAEREALKFCEEFGGKGCEIVESICLY